MSGIEANSRLAGPRRAAGRALHGLATIAALLPLMLTSPALANRFGSPGADRMEPEDPRNRSTVSVRTVPVGAFCVRVVEVVGYDPRLNQRLYRVRLDSGVLASLGITAYENALAFARTENDALRSLDLARHDAETFRRSPGQCGQQ